MGVTYIKAYIRLYMKGKTLEYISDYVYDFVNDEELTNSQADVIIDWAKEMIKLGEL